MTKYLPIGLSVCCISLVRAPDWQALILFGKALFSPTLTASLADANLEASMAVRDRKACKITACNKLWRTIAKLLAGAGLVALLWAPAPTALAQQEDVIESGQQQFNQQRPVCHGLEGQGNGVLGPHLKEQPGDLSRLSERNGGTFPFWEVYGKIDDRNKVGAHGSGDMPVWGTDERYDGGPADGLRWRRFWRLSSSCSPFRENNVFVANYLSSSDDRMPYSGSLFLIFIVT